MTLRGKVAIVGIGEVPTRRTYPGRSNYGLAAEATRLAIQDAGIRKEDINGIVADGGLVPALMAQYIGIRPTFATSVNIAGASGVGAVILAASAIEAGLCDTVLVTLASARDPDAGGGGGGGGGVGGALTPEWEVPYGLAAGMNTGYGMMYMRHMHEFGTKPEQLAKMAVDQRFNALKNPNAVFHDQPITIQDVLNSRYINYPLHILESVMPCAGAAACIVTTAERAKALPNRGAYLLGAGMEMGTVLYWESPRLTTAPSKVSAARAFQMAGYSPKDMQFAEFYD